LNTRFMTLLMGTALSVLAAGAAGAADGDALYSGKGCAACHGADGNSPINSSYPRLAGQNRDYLIQQIKDIKSGERDNGLTAQMRPIAEGLSEAEIESIADYLSSL
jgi:cytochrome c